MEKRDNPMTKWRKSVTVTRRPLATSWQFLKSCNCFFLNRKKNGFLRTTLAEKLPWRSLLINQRYPNIFNRWLANGCKLSIWSDLVPDPLSRRGICHEFNAKNYPRDVEAVSFYLSRKKTGNLSKYMSFKHPLVSFFAKDMSQLLLLGKVEYGGGPIFKVVLEC